MDALYVFLLVLAGLLLVFGLLRLGFVISPKPYPPQPEPSNLTRLEPFAPGLPEPVRRHFAATLGEPAPVMETALAWGRAQRCVNGLWLPLRFKAWYRAGDGFLRLMEVTWFRQTVLTARDGYLNGQGISEIGGRGSTGADVDQWQRLALWAEAVWFPSALIHFDLAAHSQTGLPAVSWQPVDGHTARLVLPGQDELLAHFDPVGGRMTHFSALRARRGGEPPEPWRLDLLEWKRFGDVLLPSHASAAWGLPGAPYVYWTLDGIVYNVAVSDRLGEA